MTPDQIRDLIRAVGTRNAIVIIRAQKAQEKTLRPHTEIRRDSVESPTKLG